jgi:hypothetical protein
MPSYFASVQFIWLFLLKVIKQRFVLNMSFRLRILLVTVYVHINIRNRPNISTSKPLSMFSYAVYFNPIIQIFSCRVQGSC